MIRVSIPFGHSWLLKRIRSLRRVSLQPIDNVGIPFRPEYFRYASPSDLK